MHIYTHMCTVTHTHLCLFLYARNHEGTLIPSYKIQNHMIYSGLVSSHVCIFLLSDKSVPTVLNTLEWNKSLNYVGYVFIHGTVESSWLLPDEWPTDSYLFAMAETSDPTSPGSVQANNIFYIILCPILFLLNFIMNLFMCIFIFGCTGSSLLCEGFLLLWWATLHCGTQASHCDGFSCCGAQALGIQASVVAGRRPSSFSLRRMWGLQWL